MSGDGADDILAATPPSVVRGAGGVALAAGADALLVAVQTATGFGFSGTTAVFLAVLALVGAATAASGLALMRGRGWSALGALVSSIALLLASAAWFLFSLANGLFSFFGLFAPMFALCAVVLAAVSIGPVKRVAAARDRLKAQGLDLGT
jgi:hypothetical protein